MNNCSECIKQDVCPHKVKILEALAGVVDNIFGPQNQAKRIEIERFIVQVCTKKVSHSELERVTI